MAGLELPDPLIEFAAHEGADEHVVPTVELLPVGLDLVPGRVAEHGVEAGVPLVEEHLGKLELPMEEALAVAYPLELRPPGAAPGVAVERRGVGDEPGEFVPLPPDLGHKGAGGAEVEEQAGRRQGLLRPPELGPLKIHLLEALWFDPFPQKVLRPGLVYQVAKPRRLPDGLAHRLLERKEDLAPARLAGRQGAWRVLQPLHPGAEERVTAADVVLEEREGPIAGHGLDPEGHPGELHGGGVHVHPEEAALRDAPLAPGPGLGVGRPGLLVGGLPVGIPPLFGGGDEAGRGLSPVLLHIGPVEGLAEEAHGFHQEVGAAAGRIQHPEPLDLRRPLARHQRPQGMADEVADKSPRGVIGAAALSARPGDEVEVPRLKPPEEPCRSSLLDAFLLFTSAFSTTLLLGGRLFADLALVV